MLDPDFHSVSVRSDDFVARTPEAIVGPRRGIKNLGGKAERRQSRGSFTPTKLEALRAYAKATDEKRDTVTHLLATMNRSQRRQFAANARAHARRQARIALESARHHARRALDLAEDYVASDPAAPIQLQDA